ncbi:MAG: hypothetical protein XE00_0286 [Desulfofundulus kuznetsovii]|nr:MAG: hypothetical protein XD84_1870 [Desulfotomaculum sp. 46_80]KUK85101.1 MAG: hypothetical protein XE00_0286 [Desulfofundulus kuznetsovii]
MRPFDRFLLFLYTFILTAIFLAAVPFFAGWLQISQNQPRLLQSVQQPAVIILLLGLFIIAGIRLLWVNIKPAREQAVVYESKLGNVHIALGAIESLAEKVVSQNNGIREVKAQVFNRPQGIGIRIKAAVTPDISIPEVSDTVQEQVKERVLSVTGITVQQVEFLVHSISAGKLRVE